MGRPRLKDAQLPRRVYKRNGRFYYVQRKTNKWISLGTDFSGVSQIDSLVPLFPEKLVHRHLARLLSRAKERAKRRGLRVSLSWDEILELWTRSGGRCEVTGLPFKFEKEEGFTRRPYAPSLDRIKSSGPYEFGNCRLICTAINIAINEWGLEHFKVFARALHIRSRDL